ncbi:hypothetical protein ACFE04_023778 [Oxalis oulophora]
MGKPNRTEMDGARDLFCQPVPSLIPPPLINIIPPPLINIIPSPPINIQSPPPINIQPPPGRRQITMCPSNQNGRCHLGNRCRAAHSLAELESGRPRMRIRLRNRNNVTESEIMEYFEQFGAVRRVDLFRGHFGFVYFRLNDSLDNVFAMGRKHRIRGFAVKVSPDTENGDMLQPHHLERVIGILDDS